jgi:hypothetical protein
MEIFYLTFGQKSPARNGWIKVYARDYWHARELVIAAYDKNWSMLRPKDKFEKKWFPAGCLGVLE